jgi:hypothetical protein
MSSRAWGKLEGKGEADVFKDSSLNILGDGPYIRMQRPPLTWNWIRHLEIN